MSSTADQERFVALETKIAYQEKLLADLSEVLAKQSKELEELRKRQQALERAFREANDADQTAVPHERPPHY